MRREELPGGARPPKPSTLRRTENLVIPRRAKPDAGIRFPLSAAYDAHPGKRIAMSLALLAMTATGCVRHLIYHTPAEMNHAIRYDFI